METGPQGEWPVENGSCPQVKELPEARETWSKSVPSAVEGAGLCLPLDLGLLGSDTLLCKLLSVVLRDGSACKLTWGRSV